MHVLQVAQAVMSIMQAFLSAPALTGKSLLARIFAHPHIAELHTGLAVQKARVPLHAWLLKLCCWLLTMHDHAVYGAIIRPEWMLGYYVQSSVNLSP